MDQDQVERWEQALTPEQREQLALLRARHCRVEAVFVPADETHGVVAHLRLSAVVDHLLLTSQHEAHDVRVAFDTLYKDVTEKLTLPESTRPGFN